MKEAQDQFDGLRQPKGMQSKNGRRSGITENANDSLPSTDLRSEIRTMPSALTFRIQLIIHSDLESEIPMVRDGTHSANPIQSCSLPPENLCQANGMPRMVSSRMEATMRTRPSADCVNHKRSSTYERRVVSFHEHSKGAFQVLTSCGTTSSLLKLLRTFRPCS